MSSSQDTPVATPTATPSASPSPQTPAPTQSPTPTQAASTASSSSSSSPISSPPPPPSPSSSTSSRPTNLPHVETPTQAQSTPSSTPNTTPPIISTQPLPGPTPSSSSGNNNTPTNQASNSPNNPSPTSSNIQITNVPTGALSVTATASMSVGNVITGSPSSQLTTLTAATTVVSESASLLTSNGQIYTTIVHATVILPPGSTITPTQALPSPSDNGNAGASKKGGIKTGAIAGGIFGGIALACIICALIFLVRRRLRRLEKTEFDGNFDPSRVILGGEGTLPDMSTAGLSAAALDIRRLTDEKRGSVPVEDDGMGGRLDGTRVTPFPSSPIRVPSGLGPYVVQPYEHPAPDGHVYQSPPHAYHQRQPSDTRSLVLSTHGPALGGYGDPHYPGPAYMTDAYQMTNVPYDPYAGHRPPPPASPTRPPPPPSPTHATPPSTTNSSSGLGAGMIPSGKDREARAERRITNPTSAVSSQNGNHNNHNTTTAASTQGHSPARSGSERQSTISLPNPHDQHPNQGFYGAPVSGYDPRISVGYDYARGSAYDLRAAPSAYDRRMSNAYFDQNHNISHADYDNGVMVHHDGGHYSEGQTEIPPTYTSLGRR